MTPDFENKFIIKSEIFNAIQNLESLSHRDFDRIEEFVKPIKEFEDKKTVIKILVSEYIKCEDDYRLELIFYIMSMAIDKEVLKEYLWEMVKSPNYNDLARNKIITLIRQLGEFIDYEEYSKYFENPDEIIDEDTKKLLDTATYNPEAQIDFLDFISTLNKSDWELILQSFCEDFTGDNLANMLIPLLYVNIKNEDRLEYVLNCLAESGSFLAYEHFVTFSNPDKFSTKISKLAKKYANELKLKGYDKDYPKNFYKKALSISTIFECYLSVIDGCSNQCLLLARKMQNGHFQLFAAVIRNAQKIVDCFGFFEISKVEYERIYSRFLLEQKIIKIEPEVLKALLDEAEAYSLENNINIPYEYFSWKFLLSDIESSNLTFSQRVEQLASETTFPEEVDFTELFFIDTWFYDEKNQNFLSFVDNLKTIKDYKITKDFIKEMYELGFKALFNEETVNNLIKRIKILAYMMFLDNNKAYKKVLNMFKVEKNFDTLKELITKRTIYEYFLRENEKFNKKVEVSPFSKNNKEIIPLFSLEQVKEIIQEIEKAW